MTEVKHLGRFKIQRPVDEVFPLMSPEGEKLWVPGWDYVSRSPGDELRENFVFTTRGHDHAAAEAVWVVKRYEPAARRVAFYKVEPGEKVGLVEVVCREAAPGRTEVEVGYTYTALSESGEAFVASFDDAAYADFLAEWRDLLELYFSSC